MTKGLTTTATTMVNLSRDCNDPSQPHPRPRLRPPLAPSEVEFQISLVATLFEIGSTLLVPFHLADGLQLEAIVFPLPSYILQLELVHPALHVGDILRRNRSV
jgi:hypothetical protein